ncbi:MAG: molybdenum cofactor guanylyltransferase [Flavobacteriales bacterium]|nr:molybdenum cofactor guanylyltransferase [Flavobacteriales bacterium]
MSDRGWTGVVLAGGKSSRMGKDKAMIEIDGVTLLRIGIERLRPLAREVIVIGDPEKYAQHWSHVVADDSAGDGPLRGITTALKHARYVKLLVTACDMPSINDRLLMQLKNALDNGGDAVIPRHAGGAEPMAAAYHKRCLESFENCLNKGTYKLSDALVTVDTRFMDIVPGKYGWPKEIFRNINSPSDL